MTEEYGVLQKVKQLSGIQVFILAVLLMAGLMFMAKTEPYLWQGQWVEGSPWKIDFLQKGSYTAQLTYEGVGAGNAILIHSDEMQNEHGKTGVVYAREEVAEGERVVQLPFTLEQGSYSIYIELEESGGNIVSAAVQSNQLIHRDNYYVAGLLFLAVLVLALCFLSVPADRYAIPLVLVLLGLLASVPLFSESLLWGDDLDFHLTRLEGIYQGLAAGEFPVRITALQMSGYGVATGTMYPQLFLYPVALLRFLGVSLMACYKTLCVLMNVGTAFAAYYSMKAVTKSSRMGLLLAVLYTFSAYRLINVYFRAALGESLAMVFLPIVLWGTYELLWGERRWTILVLGMTGVLGSHVLSVPLCACFMVPELVCWLVGKEKTQVAGRLLDGVKAVLVTALLNASFLVPFLRFSRENLQCFALGYEDVPSSVAYFSQMFALLPTGVGTSAAQGSTMGEMPLTIGPVLLVGVALFVFLFEKNREKSLCRSLGLHCLIWGVLALLLASWIFPWKQMGNVELFATLTKSLQFTWRFLGPASLFLGVVGAIGFDKLIALGKERWICGVGLILLLLTAGSLFDSMAHERKQYTDKMEVESISLGDGLYNYSLWDRVFPVQILFQRKEAELIACNGTGIQFSNYERRGTHLTVDMIPELGKEEKIMFPVYYYPGYAVMINGEEVPNSSLGSWVSAMAPTQPARVEVYYKGFWYYSLADMVSALTLVGIVYAGLYRGRPIGQRRRTKGSRNQA